MASELFIILILLQESVNILQQQAITILGGISAAYFLSSKTMTFIYF